MQEDDDDADNDTRIYKNETVGEVRKVNDSKHNNLGKNKTKIMNTSRGNMNIIWLRLLCTVLYDLSALAVT